MTSREDIAAAFDKYADENVNTVFSGRVYSHQAPCCRILFTAGWQARDAEIAALRADAERWEKEAKRLGWKEPEPFAIWYMHDNHLFTSLPLDLEQAMTLLRTAFDGECGHYGMLCSRPNKKNVLHARDDWTEFEPQAREWISAAIDAQRKL